MSNVLDYIGRTVDVLAYDGAKPAGDVLLQQTLAQSGEGGKITTGVQKLAQRFLLELLTEKGTMIYLPQRGTDFITEARLGFFQTQLDVLTSFSQALVDARRNMRRQELETDPLDERYGAAVVEAVAVAPGLAQIYVRLESLAGRDRAVILPIKITL